MNWKYFDPTFESEIILNDLESPWAGHRYFAYDLIANLKPKTVVELGTHRGTSFFAFCQAVKDQNFECDLFAIDSWKGDPHASFYGEEVYEAVKEIVNKFYSCLQPQLLRMNFDDAIDRFEDNSIDLLHIDGYHTYEAVKHDFESWIGKMSENGIILFHDTAEKRDDFGVFRFWDELKKKYKTIEFYHSHGLGILIRNPRAKNHFAVLQDVWARYYSLYFNAKKLSGNLKYKELEVESLRKSLESSKQDMSKLSQESKQKENTIQEKENIIQEMENLIHRDEKIIHSLYNSYSWRITSPLRWAFPQIIKLFYVFFPYGSRRWAIIKRMVQIILIKDEGPNPSRHLKENGSNEDHSIPEIKKQELQTSPPQIVMVSGESDTPGHNYRVVNYSETFKDMGVPVIWTTPDSLLNNLYLLDNAKILIIWRMYFGNPFKTIVEYARKQKLTIIYDIDDYLFEPEIAEPEIIDSIRSMNQNKQDVKFYFSLMRTAIDHVDFCTCTTQELAKALNRIGKKAFVLPNGYSMSVYKLSHKLFLEKEKVIGDGLIRIGYAGGTKTHQKDFAVALPAILLIFKEFPQTILIIFGEVLSLDEFPELNEFQDRIEVRKIVPHGKLQEEISRFDINIAPLEINPFCNVKSELKFFEAAILRIPTIASPTPPFMDVITNGENGYLAYTTDDWYNYLKTLITDVECRHRIGKNSFTYALWHFGTEQRIQILYRFLTEISKDTELQIDYTLRRKQAVVFQEKISANHAIKRYSYPNIVDYEVVVEYHTGEISKAGIIIPLHNYEQFILNALDSVKSQTLPDIDLVVIDDFSTDNSLNVAVNWINKNYTRFNNCAVIKNKINSGLIATRNSGLDYIQTQFVLPLDPDIELLPKCLAQCLKVIDRCGAAFVLPGIQLIGVDEDLMIWNNKKNEIGDRIWNPLKLSFVNHIDPLALISKACWSKVGGYDTTLKPGWENYDLWLRSVEHGLFSIDIPIILARYRIPKQSMLRTTTNVNIIEQYEEIATRHPWVKSISSVLPNSLGGKIIKDEITFRSSTTILFIGHDAYLAGAQVLLLSLIKWFSEHTGIKIKIILLRNGVFLFDKYKDIAPVLIWEDVIRNFSKKRKRIKFLQEFVGNLDLIYGNTVLASTIYNELKFLKVPCITHVHELEKAIKLLLDKTAIKKMRLFTNSFIACSNPVGLNLTANHNIDPEKIATIYEFIEKKEIDFNNSKRDLREKLGLAEDGFIVLSCGTMTWRKGIDLFIETAIILKQRGHSKFNFYWIGENLWDNDNVSLKISSWNKLQEKIQNNGLLDHITFLGVKTNVFDYLLAGDVFYLPSREDPFPLVCLEAAQCSIPIICFKDAGGMPDFVEDDAGFVVPYEDVNKAVEKIIYLDNNHDILNKLGATARKKFLSRHSLDIAAPEILNFCRRVGNLHPTVSIIVPNYNCEKYLKKRLDSILNQTFKDFELILLDDSSTDQSIDVIEKYLDYPNIRLYKNPSNSGSPFKQWHKGFLQAKGDILWFAEADDFCEPDFLQKLLPNFNNASVALAYCDSLMVDESDSVIGDYGSYLDKLDSQHWKSSYQVAGLQEINFGLGVKNTIPNASAVLIRKSCVSEAVFNEIFQFRFSGDWFFYTQVIKGKDIAFCSEKLNYQRKHSQTITSNSVKDKTAIQLLFKEQQIIHENILKYFTIDSHFLNKWEIHISNQIQTWYPNFLKDDFNKFYPYNTTKERIEKAIAKSEKHRRLVFLTTNDGSSNGGSEQLWRQTAIECKRLGHDVMVIIKKWEPEPFFIEDLNGIGIEINFKGLNQYNEVIKFNPDLIIISIGDQDEGIDWYEWCKINNIPYIIVNQLTKEPIYWPIRGDIIEQVKKGYLGAEVILFTGKNNHELMERRLNCKITNAGIFYNPFDIDKNAIIPFPSMANGIKIAIIANLLRIHKGQHLAIELFNLQKWRDRPIQLNIYGKGKDEDVLKKQAKDYNLNNILFHGHTDDLLAAFKMNHAILIPSFMEGVSIVLVDAMICGRVPISTDIGSHGEIIDDNFNGFIAKKPSVEALDEALERAYQKSANWEEIGQRAREKILSFLPDDPVDDLISKITRVLNK